MTKVDEILAARGPKYGKFEHNAEAHRMIGSAMAYSLQLVGKKVDDLPPDVYTVIDMIALKLARALTGDPDVVDNWDDIAGYATLIANRLRAQEAMKEKGGRLWAIPLGWEKRSPQQGFRCLDTGRIYEGTVDALWSVLYGHRAHEAYKNQTGEDIPQ